MRIISGRLKNREVLSYKDKEGELRPTSSKTREAVFNLLKHGKFLQEIDFLTPDEPSILEGRTVADIFCGTGIMGFEAYSRGAEKLIFIDKNNMTIDLVKKTAAKMNIIEDCNFIRADATALNSTRLRADLIFLDPPYNRALVNPTLKSIALSGLCRDGGVVIVEHSIREKLEESDDYKLLDQREYNNSFISILKFLA